MNVLDTAAWTLCVAFVAVSVAVGQETTLVSVDSSGVQGSGNSGISDPNHDVGMGTAVSGDGDVVVFASDASNLVTGDLNASRDVFVHVRSSGTTEIVSVDSAGAQSSGKCYASALSFDGTVALFLSDATTLVAGDTNGVTDVFLRDRLAGTTERVSVDSAGSQGNGASGPASCSADGSLVAFASAASNLVASDTNGRIDVFVHDRTTGITELVSLSDGGNQGNSDSVGASISADGRFVAFASFASNLVAGDTNGFADVFLRDRVVGTTRRVSVDSLGNQGNGDSFAGGPSSVTTDGQIVAFTSSASNLVAGDTNHSDDIFVNDQSAGVTERVSVSSSGTQANDRSTDPTLSADGRIVAFGSRAFDLVSNDAPMSWDAFIHDRTSGVTELVSADSSGTRGDSDSWYPAIAADGLLVAFDSAAKNLVSGDLNGFVDVFVHDRCASIASWSNYGAGFPGTNGVPAFTARQNPVLGTTLTLDLDNSFGSPTAGLLFVGFQRGDIPSNWGGDLLVAPALALPITLSYGFDTFSGDIPDDWPLCGATVDLQAIELDTGASKGVSFTAGLELVVGR